MMELELEVFLHKKKADHLPGQYRTEARRAQERIGTFCGSDAIHNRNPVERLQVHCSLSVQAATWMEYAGGRQFR